MASATDDDFDSKSQAFLTWLSDAGAYVSPKISLRDLRNRSTGRGIVAVDDIQQESVLFIIPRNLVLSVSTSSISGRLPHAFAALDPWLSLILVMIYEHNRAESSFWKPYLDVLPATFDTLMFWTPDELQELQGSAVLTKIGKEAADEAFKTQIVPVVHENWRELGAGKSQQASEDEIVQLAHLMGSTIMAYAFDFEGDRLGTPDEDGYISEESDQILPKGMVPLADMLNADADLNNARLFYEQDFLAMKSLREIKKGEEIFNDYGPLPRSDLLRRYGYITPRYAKYDVAELSQDLLVMSSQSYQNLGADEVKERLAYLDQEGALEDGYDLTRQNMDEPTNLVPDNLLLLLATLLLPTEEYLRLRRKDKLPKAVLTPLVAKTLADAVTARIAQYSTTIQQDLHQLAGRSLSTGRNEMALHVRIGEKELLSAAFDFCTKAAADDSASASDSRGRREKRRKITSGL